METGTLHAGGCEWQKVKENIKNIHEETGTLHAGGCVWQQRRGHKCLISCMETGKQYAGNCVWQEGKQFLK
jgi:hypothetical protein